MPRALFLTEGFVRIAMQLLALIILASLVTALSTELRSKVLSDPPPQDTVSPVLLGESADGSTDILQEPELPPVTALTATLDRPLFVPGRRVVKTPASTPAVPPAAPKAAPFAGQFQLSAVVLTAGGLSKAIIRNPKTGKNERLNPGAVIAGWTLVSIAKDGVRLQWAEQYEDVPLQIFGDAARQKKPGRPQFRQDNVANTERRRAGVFAGRAQRRRAAVETERATRIKDLRRQWRDRNGVVDADGGLGPTTGD